ncbi:MAG: hypothetical protein JXA13_12810 [Anaerolineales bacterium]|nr:hypothetical protein [Anaerolineales bacterium]
MYIDPNVGGILFGALAAVFTAIVSIFLVFAGKIRSGAARLRRKLRKEDAQSGEENK